ncbi:MAG TPA: FtsQ-type POTRA domain-containing protein, partial [Thermoanaerobaculia bacterium]|nr:FtsQ-type POTRA domain-containing protein [Thermoanaerobaculia bacterium]
MNSFDTTQRFFRPTDVAGLRRNQRQIQIARLLVVLRNAVFVLIIAAVGVVVYRHIHRGERFAVRQIEVGGAKHTPRAALEAVTRRYVGANLFDLDISRVQNDLRGVSWIRGVNIEKKLPGTLRINIVERSAVALVQRGDRLVYVDEQGIEFAELSPRVGDEDLPLIAEAGGEELARSVALLRDLRTRDPQVYSRISEVRPIAPRGFALFDRELAAVVYANAEDVSPKWRSLYGVIRAENLGRASI